MNPTKDECEAALKKHGSVRGAAKALGLARTTFQRRIAGAAPAAKPPASKGRSLNDFRAAYDKDTIIPQRIDAALAELGKDSWAYEMEFVKMAGLGLAQLAAYRDAYADFVVPLNRDSKRAWAGSKALASKMREML